MSIELNPITNPEKVGGFNTNFQLIEEELNENVLRRDGLSPGEANHMEVDLDMNSNSILNTKTDLTNSNSLITVGDADARYVNVTGDTLQGLLDMAGYALYVRKAVADNEPARKDELDTERSQRISGDASLNQALTVERNTRISEDNRLTQERIQGDVELDNRIDSVVKGFNRSLSSEIDRVESGYQAGDSNLQAQLTGEAPLEASAFSPISWHDQVVESSVTIPENKNAWSFGPTMSIAPGQAVTISDGSFWTIANGEQQ